MLLGQLFVMVIALLEYLNLLCFFCVRILHCSRKCMFTCLYTHLLQGLILREENDQI